MRLFVFFYIDDVTPAGLHALLLFAEGTEEVFHQSPFQEGPILVDPGHFEPCELAYLGQRLLGGGYEALVLVEIDEYLYFVADSESVRHIAVGQQDVASGLVALQVESLFGLMVCP